MMGQGRHFSTARGTGAMLLACLVAACAGCNPGLGPTRAQQAQWQQQYQTWLAQKQYIEGRLGQIEQDNQNLQTELARSERQIEIWKERAGLLQTRLNETTEALAQERKSRKDIQQQFAGLRDATQRRGGATIRANSSLAQDLPTFDVPGVTARHDGNAVRIEIPADKLFLPGTATLHRDAYPVLQRVSGVINEKYRGHDIVIEGHTEDAPRQGNKPVDPHQLSSAQALALLGQLTDRYGLDRGRATIAARGATQPLVSNGSEAGKAKNRRIEIVVRQRP